jgi:hypothetical protein
VVVDFDGVVGSLPVAVVIDDSVVAFLAIVASVEAAVAAAGAAEAIEAANDASRLSRVAEEKTLGLIS